MLQECLMSDCQRKFSRENLRKESALKVAKKKRLKPRLRISTFQPGNRLHRIELSGVASSTKELDSLKQRESVKQRESAKNGKQEPMRYHNRTVRVEFATDNLEQKLAHTIKHKHSGLKMVFLNTERRTIILLKPC